MNMKILVIKPSSLGDVVHALRVISYLKKKKHNLEIHWIIKEEHKGVLEASGEIDKYLIFPRKISLFKLWSLSKELRVEKYDFALDMQGLFRSALLTVMSRSQKRFGRADGREFSKFFYHGLGDPDRNKVIHAIERLVSFLEPFKLKADKDPMRLDFREAKTNCRSEYLQKRLKEKTILLFPESRRTEKVWPRFTELSKEINQSRLGNVIICGKNKMNDFPGTSDLRGKINLNEVIELIRGASVIVCNDSAPLHFASAMGVPLVGLFGPTDSRRYGPFPKEDLNQMILSAESKLMCDITVKQVMEAIQKTLTTCGQSIK